MSMSTFLSQLKTTSAPEAHATTLGRALGQNEAAQETLEQSADELAIVNAVLKQELPDRVHSDDVVMALERNEELETRIQETAQDLAGVNKALSQEITERAKLERQLKETRSALDEATTEMRRA